MRSWMLVALLFGLPAPAAATRAAESPSDAAKGEFFEKQIRPVLMGTCVECHGAKKHQAGLRLDSREFLLKGNDSGPAIVPGDPEKSRLIQVLRYADDDTQMPPKGKLPKEQIEAFVAWIKEGAVWPGSETPVVAQGGIDFEKARREHWAYQPITRPPLPAVQHAERVRTPVDAFVIAALEQKDLTLAPEAERRTYIRRVTTDLWGIPPTIEQVEEFVSDAAPDAHARLIDRLLASPLYGQRWGRHWLDVARYADTKGYVFTEEIRYPYSYTYRDYVIRAFNEDRPYDRFITEQLAADQLELGDDKAPLAALGFLTLGQRFRNSQPDIIDDRIDVVTRGLMGMTVACARCHDHKFDPIPTEDYYSLYGVFAASVEPKDLPLLAEPSESEAYQKYEAELAKRQKTLDDYVAESRQHLLDELRTRTGDYLMQVAMQMQPAEKSEFLSYADGEPRPRVVERWKRYLDQIAKEPHPVFLPWTMLVKTPAAEFERRVAQLVEQSQAATSGANEASAVNRLVREAIVQQPPKTIFDLATLYGRLLTQVEEQVRAKRKAGIAADQIKLDDPAAEELRRVLYGANAPTMPTDEELRRLIDRATREKTQKLQRDIDQFRVNSPVAPPRAMALNDMANPPPARVLIRGNPARPGKNVPRRFPRILATVNGTEFQHGSGRLELAQAITDRHNPLTARVLVNRVWLEHFGKGLVTTPSDFGARGEPPTHPELLDWLAWEFMEHGWSIKWLHRTILLSATYRQSSRNAEFGMRSVESIAPIPNSAIATPHSIDPENRLLWRMPRLRLDWEAMRDSLLAVAGRLDPTLGGRPVEILDDPANTRRSVYGFINRNDVPGTLRIFDVADPDVSSPQRPQTTVPQQALFGMNSKFIVRQVKALASHPRIASLSDPAARIQALYRRVLLRDPTADEIDLGLNFVAAQEGIKDAKLSPWEKYAQVLLLTNEFLFVD